MTAPDFSDLDIRALRCDALDDFERRAVIDLFELTYDRASHDYLQRSMQRLRFLALALHGDTPAGFAVADVRRMALPRLGVKVVALAGISCIAPPFRRRGLFRRLEELAGAASGVERGDDRWLACGRMAHPASMRILGRDPSVVPRPGVSPTPWQREVGLTVAAAYGSTLDPETFVCVGTGTPVGYPKLEVDATAEEWALFDRVDRDRGDSLLTIAWRPDAPAGW